MGPNVTPRRAAARAVVVALTALALLLAGVGELPSTRAGGPVTAAAVSDAPQPAPAAMSAPAAALQVRAAGVAVVPAPTGPAVGPAPGAGPLVAPHLVAEPQSRPPTARLTAASLGAPGSRAPPGPAGT